MTNQNEMNKVVLSTWVSEKVAQALDERRGILTRSNALSKFLEDALLGENV